MGGREHRGHDASRRIETELADRLTKQCEHDGISGAAAILLIHEQSEPTVLGHFLEHFLGEFPIRVMFTRVLATDFLVHEAVDRIAPQALLVCELEIHGSPFDGPFRLSRRCAQKCRFRRTAAGYV